MYQEMSLAASWASAGWVAARDKESNIDRMAFIFVNVWNRAPPGLAKLLQPSEPGKISYGNVPGNELNSAGCGGGDGCRGYFADALFIWCGFERVGRFELRRIEDIFRSVLIKHLLHFGGCSVKDTS